MNANIQSRPIKTSDILQRQEDIIAALQAALAIYAKPVMHITVTAQIATNVQGTLPMQYVRERVRPHVMAYAVAGQAFSTAIDLEDLADRMDWRLEQACLVAAGVLCKDSEQAEFLFEMPTWPGRDAGRQAPANNPYVVSFDATRSLEVSLGRIELRPRLVILSVWDDIFTATWDGKPILFRESSREVAYVSWGQTIRLDAGRPFWATATATGWMVDERPRLGVEPDWQEELFDILLAAGHLTPGEHKTIERAFSA